MNIFRRFRRWLIDKFLPAYIRETDREDMARMRRRIADLETEKHALEAYISGLQYGYRAMRKINITMKGGGAGGTSGRTEEHQ